MFQMAGSLDPTKLPLTGGTLTGDLSIDEGPASNNLIKFLNAGVLKAQLAYVGSGGNNRLQLNNLSGGGILDIGTVIGYTDRCNINVNNVMFPVQAPTASAPAYVKGGIYFDTTQNRLRVAEGIDWQTKGNFNNLLAPLTPTFANWTQNPGTNADIVDELSSAVLTTAGIGQAGDNTIIYDLGTSKRRIIWIQSEEPFDVSISDSNGSYQTIIGDGTIILNAGNSGIGKFRWLMARLNGVKTASYLKLRCYSLE